MDNMEKYIEEKEKLLQEKKELEKTYYDRLSEYAAEKKNNPSNIDEHDLEYQNMVKQEKWDNILKNKVAGIKSYYYSKLQTNGYDDIQIILITKDETYLYRDKRQGSNHYRIISNILGIEDIDNIFETANKFGCVIMEFSSRYDPIITITPTPIDLNEYQISELERINEEIKEVNLLRDAQTKVKFIYQINDDELSGTLNTLIEIAKNNNINNEEITKSA